MKKIGIIGGGGPLASALLLETIIRECYMQGCKSESDLPEIILVNYPFSITMCTEKMANGIPKICSVLQRHVNQLESCHVDLIAIACNTFHLFLDCVMFRKSKLVSIAQSTLQVAIRSKLSRLFILGTPLTVQNRLYKSGEVACQGPIMDDQKVIEAIINRVLAGIVLKSDAVTLNALIARYCKKNMFDGIILGCTELSVLCHRFPLKFVHIPHNPVVLDPIKILAKQLVKESIGL